MIQDKNIWQYDKNPDKCPICHSFITPDKIHSEFYINENRHIKEIRIFFRCTNLKCKEPFIAYYSDKYNNWHYYLGNTLPKNYLEEKFDDEIKEVSEEFITIYNQSLMAETIGLNKIAWVWFRKSLEFLIKDYVILLNPDDEENIKKQFLWNVISEKISDDEIKEIAKRATWIWNDETHYVKKWEDKDISDLKILIDITQSFISKKQKAKKYLESMN